MLYLMKFYCSEKLALEALNEVWGIQFIDCISFKTIMWSNLLYTINSSMWEKPDAYFSDKQL